MNNDEIISVDYYDILEIKPNASFAEIKEAYEKKKNTSPNKEDINEAYECLSHDETRMQYDNMYSRECRIEASKLLKYSIEKQCKLKKIKKEKVFQEITDKIIINDNFDELTLKEVREYQEIIENEYKNLVENYENNLPNHELSSNKPTKNSELSAYYAKDVFVNEYNKFMNELNTMIFSKYSNYNSITTELLSDALVNFERHYHSVKPEDYEETIYKVLCNIENFYKFCDLFVKNDGEIPRGFKIDVKEIDINLVWDYNNNRFENWVNNFEERVLAKTFIMEHNDDPNGMGSRKK